MKLTAIMSCVLKQVLITCGCCGYPVLIMVTTGYRQPVQLFPLCLGCCYKRWWRVKRCDFGGDKNWKTSMNYLQSTFSMSLLDVDTLFFLIQKSWSCHQVMSLILEIYLAYLVGENSRQQNRENMWIRRDMYGEHIPTPCLTWQLAMEHFPVNCFF